MPEVTVRVHVMLKPDGITAEWTYYYKVLTFDVVPIPGDILMILGPNPPELHSAGPAGSTSWVPSDQALLASVTVGQRFFTPKGRVVLDAVPPARPHIGAEDDNSTSDWGAVLQTLEQAGYRRQDSSLVDDD